MKRFLAVILTVIAVCCGVAALSACSHEEVEEKPVYGGYGEDIEYRMAVTSEDECPAGNITEDKLHTSCELWLGKTYFIVLDLTFKNFNWAGDRYSVVMYIGEHGGFSCTLHEANTANFEVKEEEGNYYSVTTRHSVPRDRDEQKTDRIVYQIHMTGGAYDFAANFEIDEMGKSPTFSVGYGMTFEMNADNATYAVTGINDKDVEEVTIPDHYGKCPVTAVAGNAFSGCAKLTEINIPATITFFGRNSFNGCKALKYIWLDDLAVWCSAEFEDETANPLSVNEEVLLRLNSGKWNEDYNDYYKFGIVDKLYVPYSVTQISDYAFYGYKRLEVMSANGEKNNLISIGKSAFRNCVNLEEVHLGNMLGLVKHKLETIGDEAFMDCENLETIYLPNSLISIGASAFENCKLLAKVDVYSNSSNIKSIGDRAFWRCANLTNISLPDNLISIGKQAFYSCGLTGITIPASVTHIGEGAFNSCLDFDSATFKNATGWYVDGKDVSKYISDNKYAAQCLTSKYDDYEWNRIDG